MIRTALALVQRKLAVFLCRPRDKRPATANGLRDATTDANLVAQWWRANPDCNNAIATGAISHVFVVDVDGLDAEIELRNLEAAHGPLPPTVEAITAHGRHIYFRMPAAELRNSAGKVAPGIDVRASGGYVLAPPSVHPSGRLYAWSVDSANAFAAAPDWLLNKVAAPAAANSNGMPSAEWRELIKGVAEGARNCSVAKIAGYLLRRRIDPFMALELLQAWNETRCMPPLPPRDIGRIVNSIAGKELKRRAADGR